MVTQLSKQLCQLLVALLCLLLEIITFVTKAGGTGCALVSHSSAELDVLTTNSREDGLSVTSVLPARADMIDRKITQSSEVAC